MNGIRDKVLEKAKGNIIAMMIFENRNDEIIDDDVVAYKTCTDLAVTIQNMITDNFTVEESVKILNLLEDYTATLEESYFVYGFQAGAKALKELAFG